MLFRSFESKQEKKGRTSMGSKGTSMLVSLTFLFEEVLARKSMLVDKMGNF